MTEEAAAVEGTPDSLDSGLTPASHIEAVLLELVRECCDVSASKLAGSTLGILQDFAQEHGYEGGLVALATHSWWPEADEHPWPPFWFRRISGPTGLRAADRCTLPDELFDLLGTERVWKLDDPAEPGPKTSLAEAHRGNYHTAAKAIWDLLRAHKKWRESKS